MANSYLKRLADEQIAEFLQRQYPEGDGYSFKILRTTEAVYVLMEHKYSCELNFSFILKEYGSELCSCNKQWMKYLYEIFGEEYKKSYMERCAQIFD